MLTLALAGCGGANDAPAAGSISSGPTNVPQATAASPTAGISSATEEPTTTDPIVATPTSEIPEADPSSRAETDASAVTVTGLLATVPGYLSVSNESLAEITGQAFPDSVPGSVQLLVLITEQGDLRLVVGIDSSIDRFVTAGTVIGHEFPLPDGLPSDLDFANGILISDDITLMEPISATPEQVNGDPERFAFKRVVMDTAYVFGGARIKNAPPGLDHIGFGLATNELGSSNRNDYLTIVDPYNTEAQIRVASITGTVLFPNDGVRRLLGEIYRFAPSDLEEALGKPSMFYESLVDDEPQLLNIGELIPTLEDPSLKLQKYHSETISVQGIALGAMVRTEDIPPLKSIPISLTGKIIGVLDLTGTLPIIGISSEDVDGDVFGFFRFTLSVYDFGGGAAYAFLVGKDPVALDPVEEVTRAEFGDRVRSSFTDYLVTETESVQMTSGLSLKAVDLLVPLKAGDPIIMTNHSGLNVGDYLDTVDIDGFLIDGRMLNLPEALLEKHGARVVVVEASGVEFERGVQLVPAIPSPGLTPVVPGLSIP